MNGMDEKTASKVRRAARRIYNVLRAEGSYTGRYGQSDYQYAYETGHPSHAASVALELASKHYGVGYGVEGFCDQSTGRHGIVYVSMGDTYALTVLFKSDTRQFRVGTYGDVIEHSPRGWYA